MMSPERYEQAVEDFIFLAALRHRRLHDGRIVDPRAEGLLSVVKAYQEWPGPVLDVAELVLVS